MPALRAGFPRWPDLAVLAILATVVAWLFGGHLAGHLTFPWDFQGGYHTHAVARLRDGTFLTPPLWMPWGGFGIPSQLSLQDGTWYFPLYIYNAIAGYDLVAATRLQVLHVFAGGVGVFALSRSFDIPRAAAMVAGVAYLLASTFYSNAQHVDIVRGAAILPWLVLAVHALWQQQTAIRFLALVVVLWQYLAAAYPGQIVATAYFCIGVVAIFIGHALQRREPWLGRASLIGLGAACATSLIMLKFLPTILDPESVRQSAAPDALVDRAVLTTLLFDFDLAFLPNDISMRDLFVPACLLPFIVFGVQRNQTAYLAILGVVLTALFVSDIPSLQAVVGSIPLARVSRFPLSDFRPILHLSTCLLAALGIARAIRSEDSGRFPWLGMAVLLVGVLLLTWHGLRVGQAATAVWWSLGALASGLAVLAWLRIDRRSSPAWRQVSAVLLAAVVVAHGAAHQFEAARTWRAAHSLAQEYANYGEGLRELTSVNRFDALDYRPARVVYEALPAATLAGLYSVKYQYGWYAEGFSAFGYETVKASPRIRQLYSLALKDATALQQAVLNWLLRRSSVYVLAEPGDLTAPQISACQEPVCGAGPGEPAAVAMEAFREQGAVYRVAARSPTTLVENEVYYPGWASLVCDARGCEDGPAARPANQLLRSWTLPAGEYRLVTYFVPPGWRISVAIAWFGAFVALCVVVILAIRRPGRRGLPVPS